MLSVPSVCDDPVEERCDSAHGVCVLSQSLVYIEGFVRLRNLRMLFPYHFFVKVDTSEGDHCETLRHEVGGRESFVLIYRAQPVEDI